MEYKVIRHSESNDDYIEHAIFGLGSKKGGMQKGGQKENHLYLARQWIGNKWRYAYTQAQVRAMQNWGKGRDGGLADQKKLRDLQRQSKEYNKAANKAGAQIKRNVNRAVSDAQSSVYSKYNTAKTNADTAVTKLKNNTEKAVGTVKKTARNAADAVDRSLEYVRDGTAPKSLKIKAETAKNDIVRTANKVREAAPQIAKNAAGAVKEAATNTAGAVKEAATNTANKARDFTKDLPDYANKVDTKARGADLEKLASLRLDNMGTDRYWRSMDLNGDQKKNVQKTAFKLWDAAYNLKESGRSKSKAATNEKKSAKYKVSKALRDAGDAIDKGKNTVSNILSNAKSSVSSAATTTLKAASDLADKGKKKIDHMADVLSGNYAKKLDENTRRYNEYQSRSKKTYQVSSSTKEDEAKRALEAFLARLDNNDKHAASNRNNEKAKQSADYKVSKAISDAKRSASDTASSALSSARSKINSALKSANDIASDIKDLAAENYRYYTDRGYREVSNAASSLGKQLDAIDDALAEAAKNPQLNEDLRGLRNQRNQVAAELSRFEGILDDMKDKK